MSSDTTSIDELPTLDTHQQQPQPQQQPQQQYED
jgi:hypothetical protein